MALFTKLTKNNIPPSNQEKSYFVRAGLFNTLVNNLNRMFTALGAAKFDTISEYTSDNGVSVDGVVLKDSSILFRDPVEIVTATNVITAAESGTVFYLNTATGFASTLPAPAAGLRFRFVVSTPPVGGTYTVVTNGGDNIIDGQILLSGGSTVADNEDTITFTDGNGTKGDWIEVISNGTRWYIEGQGHAAGSITATN